MDCAHTHTHILNHISLNYDFLKTRTKYSLEKITYRSILLALRSMIYLSQQTRIWAYFLFQLVQLLPPVNFYAFTHYTVYEYFQLVNQSIVDGYIHKFIFIFNSYTRMIVVCIYIQAYGIGYFMHALTHVCIIFCNIFTVIT